MLSCSPLLARVVYSTFAYSTKPGQDHRHQLARDVHHVVLLGPFDYHSDTQLWPHPQIGAPASGGLFDFLAKRPLDTTRMRTPAVGTDQQRPHGLQQTGAHLPQ